MTAFRARSSILGGLIAASVAAAQPLAPRKLEPSANLALIHDDRQLADALTAIVQDPTIQVEDARARPLAKALMTEGVRQAQAGSDDQALANLLAAYTQLPSPRILLTLGPLLRDMGRLADAANTYQRFLTDARSPADRKSGVQEILERLDAQLTVLVVHVVSHGSEVSVDGGPFITVEGSLVTRVPPGFHLVRIRNAATLREIPINGFEGERKEVPPAVEAGLAPESNAAAIASAGQVDGWLITGTRYGTAAASSRERHVRAGYAGPEIAPIIPAFEAITKAEAVAHDPEPTDLGPAIVGIMRIDGKGRGFAAGLGLAFTPVDQLEIELAGLRSDVWGAYVGARYRFLGGALRPYVGAGLPMFFFTDSAMQSRVAPGLRAAAGVELAINAHVSVEGDLGYEHFFNLGNTSYEADLFVPTVGVIVRR